MKKKQNKQTIYQRISVLQASVGELATLVPGAPSVTL